MKQYRTFKLIYTWEKHPYNSKFFHHYSENQASNIVELPCWSSSATDKKTILARCKMELKSKGYYGGNPVQLLEYVNGVGYQFVK